MEKEEVIEHVRRVSSSSDHDRESQQTRAQSKWEPGYLVRFPWAGLGSLLGVLLCAAASVAILVASNNRSETHWPKAIAPNVLLSVMNGIANICFAVAIVDGVSIAWWRKAIKGSSIAELHRSWEFSSSPRSILRYLKYINVIALAALAAKLTLIDSTLMQRATGTYLGTDAPVTVSNITGFANQTFPVTGTVVGLDEQPGLMMHWLGDTLKMWSQSGGIYPNQWTGCEGTCYLDVPGIGFAIDCDDIVKEPVDYGTRLVQAHRNGENATATLFDLAFGAVYYDGSDTLSGVNSSYLEMNVSYTNASDTSTLSCPGIRFAQSCKLWPAVINYPVQITNTTLDFTVSIGASKPFANGSSNYEDLPPYNRALQQQDSFEVLRRIPILESHTSAANNINSSLSGIQLALNMYIAGNSILSWDDSFDGAFVIDQMGHAANYMTDPPQDIKSCAFIYNDPLDSYHAPNGLFSVPSVVAKINQIMFGLSTDISEDDRNNNRLEGAKAYDGTEYRQAIHYRSNFAYMGGAVAVTILCVLLVLPVYWGFWELGRKVTLNPLEIAHAFRSPVIAQAADPRPDELIQEVGQCQIKYGPIVSGDGRGYFGVAEPQQVADVPQSPGIRSSWRISRASTNPR